MPKISVSVVVNGQPTQVEAQSHQSVEALIEPALKQTGNAGQPAANWELRDGAGTLLTAQQKVDQFASQTLFLNLKAGIGG